MRTATTLKKKYDSRNNTMVVSKRQRQPDTDDEYGWKPINKSKKARINEKKSKFWSDVQCFTWKQVMDRTNIDESHTHTHLEDGNATL